MVTSTMLCSCGGPSPSRPDGGGRVTMDSGGPSIPDAASPPDSAVPLASCPSLDVTPLGPASVVPPSRVSAFFRVECGSEGVAGLDFPDNFALFEDGDIVSIFESQPLVVRDPQNFAVFSLILLDLSGSITRSSGGVAELRSAVLAFLNVLESSGLRHPLAVYAFDGRAALTEIAPFTDDWGSLRATIEGISCDDPDLCRDPSTNLNGAVHEGIGLIEARATVGRSEAEFVETFLVTFSDGTDQAGRVSFDTAVTSVRDSMTNSFAVGIEGESDEDALRAFGRDGYEPAGSIDLLSTAFEAIAQRVADRAGSYYRVEYCSPRRAGTHDLTVQVTHEGATGSLSYAFDATGFTYGCVADPSVCAYGDADCDVNGTCETDLAISNEHCGGCDVPCPTGQTCRGAMCQPICAPGLVVCGTECVDLDTDARHCGACGAGCMAREVCNAGLCRCPSPYTACGSECVDTTSDARHCGGCGSACDPAEFCNASTCECSDPSATHCLDGCLTCGGISPDGYCGVNGPSRCCGSGNVFCDRPGLGTGCFGPTSDCATWTSCGGRALVCAAGYSSHCGADGVSYCCDSSGFFCDPAVYPGVPPCWTGTTDCTRVVRCSDGTWHGCDPGFTYDCSTSTCR